MSQRLVDSMIRLRGDGIEICMRFGVVERITHACKFRWRDQMSGWRECEGESPCRVEKGG
jgi:hypothetical protein